MATANEKIGSKAGQEYRDKGAYKNIYSVEKPEQYYSYNKEVKAHPDRFVKVKGFVMNPDGSGGEGHIYYKANEYKKYQQAQKKITTSNSARSKKSSLLSEGMASQKKAPEAAYTTKKMAYASLLGDGKSRGIG